MFGANNNRSVNYTCTALVGTNKTGKLEPDESGYYTLVVGALDVFNSAGSYYPLETGKLLFEDSSSFMRRVRDGSCKGETGHPEQLPGQSIREYIQRLLRIKESNVCCHFRSFRLEEIDDGKGKKVCGIIAEIKPAGPHGPALKEALENGDENVCFSIRSLTNDVRMPTGIIHKNLKTVVTFDWVTEPGIYVAKKWRSPALESLEETEVIPEYLDSIEEVNSLSPASMEHAVIDVDTLRKELGWDKPQPVASAHPPSAGW